MAKQLKFTHNDKEYTLEFNRKTVAQMELNGFIANEIDNKPVTGIPELFAGAFLAHHKWEKREVIDDIYEHMTNRQTLIEKLSEMYNEPVMTLIEEPDPKNKGNLKWTASW